MLTNLEASDRIVKHILVDLRTEKDQILSYTFQLRTTTVNMRSDTSLVCHKVTSTLNKSKRFCASLFIDS